MKQRCDYCPRPAVEGKSKCLRHLHAPEAKLFYPSPGRKPRKAKRRGRKWDLAGNPQWQAVSRSWLSEHPWCERCKRRGKLDGGPRLWPAVHVDHIIPLPLLPISRYFDTSNLQSLCLSCHSTKTALERKGQFADYARGIMRATVPKDELVEHRKAAESQT